MSFWDPSWNHYVFAVYLPCMALGGIYDHPKFTKILFEKEWATVPFCWSHHLLLPKPPSYLSSFLAPGWVLLRNENESKGNLKSGSSLERTNNSQCQCLSISWRQGERWGVFWSEAWKGWRKGQSANICLLFSWFT